MFWKSEPEEHDYAAAFDYLSLLIKPAAAKTLVVKLKKVAAVERAAKDILRASELALLPKADRYVASDLKRAETGQQLSPILLVRGSVPPYRLVVADGYHRVCAAWHLGEDTAIPCRLVSQ